MKFMQSVGFFIAFLFGQTKDAGRQSPINLDFIATTGRTVIFAPCLNLNWNYGWDLWLSKSVVW